MSFPDYDALIDDPEVEAVYISLPNHLHFEWTRKALLKGKHVLCEKPVTLDSSQVDELKSIASERRLVVSEGLMYRHHLQTARIRELIQAGRMGRLKHIRVLFHSVLPPDDKIRLDPAVGGGVHWDIGCYLVDLVQFLTGQIPGKIQSWIKRGDHRAVEAMSSTLSFRDGLTARLDCSYFGPRQEGLELTFEKGWASVPRPFKPAQSEELKVVYLRNPESITVQDPLSPYERQIRDFEEAIAREENPSSGLPKAGKTSKHSKES